MTPKRRSVFSLIFIVNCISKFNLITTDISQLYWQENSTLRLIIFSILISSFPIISAGR